MRRLVFPFVMSTLLVGGALFVPAHNSAQAQQITEQIVDNGVEVRAESCEFSFELHPLEQQSEFWCFLQTLDGMKGTLEGILENLDETVQQCQSAPHPDCDEVIIMTEQSHEVFEMHFMYEIYNHYWAIWNN